MRTLRSLFLGTVASSFWPAYVALFAYAARQAPWPRVVGTLTGTALGLAALAMLAANLIGWVLAPAGWAETELGVPSDVARQLRRCGKALVLAHVAFLLPAYLLDEGLLAPGGRIVLAPAFVRGLVMTFEVSVLVIVVRLARRRSPLFAWLAQFPERLGWLNRHRGLLAGVAVAAVVSVIVLDGLGYSYSARRLAAGMAGSLVATAVAWGIHRLTVRAIDHHAWRWRRLGKSLAGLQEAHGEDGASNDLAGRLRRLSGYLAVGIGLFLASWAWDVDLALFEFLGKQTLPGVDTVTFGDLTRAVVILSLAAWIWRNLSTFFAVAVFPRMPDDPGIRFAVVTLCRYAVLGVGLLCGLSAVHLGLEKIGMVLAALGVGLGFGLQEIVSNFVCGIILLLERPIRVGDIVTVSGMTGKVDRINIRATTITNGDNQSMIVPNRAFITGDLVNWTLKDKIIRVTIRVRVAHGTDPDRVSDLLLTIARDDADVLRNPMPSAFMEEFSESSLLFLLHAYVPDPSLGGRVKHRLFAQIQRRFDSEGIPIPLPMQRLLVESADGEASGPTGLTSERYRVDPPGRTPPLPWWTNPSPRPTAEPADEGHRGVDE
jgi:small-conductance mechanosensitive channel